MRIALPTRVRMIIHTLQAEGYEAYAVGGCVRDRILGREPDGWEITTSAKPEKVNSLLMAVKADDLEITTYTNGLAEDLLRRDFAINAMAYNDRDGLIDLYSGMSDLQRKAVRSIGDAVDRFADDPLRMMRAIRFSAQLSFQIDDKTEEAIRVLAPSLSMVGPERMTIEIIKLLTSEHPEYLRKAYELGLTKVFMPEFDQMMMTEQMVEYQDYSVGKHTLYTLKKSEDTKVQRLAALLHDVGKPSTKVTDENGVDSFPDHEIVGCKMAEEIMRRWEVDEKTIGKVLTIIRYHDWRVDPEEDAVREAVEVIGTKLFGELLKLQAANTFSQNQYGRIERAFRIDGVRRLFDEYLEAHGILQ